MSKESKVNLALAMIPFLGRVATLVQGARTLLKEADAERCGLTFPCAVLCGVISGQDTVRPGCIDLTHAAATARSTAITANTHGDMSIMRLALCLADACLALSFVQEGEPAVADVLLTLAERELLVSQGIHAADATEAKESSDAPDDHPFNFRTSN